MPPWTLRHDEFSAVARATLGAIGARVFIDSERASAQRRPLAPGIASVEVEAPITFPKYDAAQRPKRTYVIGWKDVSHALREESAPLGNR